MVLSSPQRSLCVVGRLGRETKKASRARWELRQREKRGLRLPPFSSSHRPPRAFYFSSIAIFVGIPSGSLCGEKSQWFKTHFPRPRKGKSPRILLFCFQFCAKSLFSAFTHTQNAPAELWRRYHPISPGSTNHNIFWWFLVGVALNLGKVGPTFLTKPGALFSKVPVTFRTRKAVLCFPCLYSRSKFYLFWKWLNETIS